MNSALFVYGTLQPGGKYYPRYCAGRTLRESPARVRGRLFHLTVEGYPALTVGDEWVGGWLLEFPPAMDWSEIDRLEDFHPSRPPGANFYRRVRLPVFSPDLAPRGTAWTYRMDPSTVRSHGGRHLPDGTWPGAMAGAIEQRQESPPPADSQPRISSGRPAAQTS